MTNEPPTTPGNQRVLDYLRKIAADGDWEWLDGDTTMSEDVGEFLREYEGLRAEVDRLRTACSKLNDEVCQTLGRALGYPRFADDQANFPGATNADGVCVGDEVAETLAMEAARRLGMEKK